MMLERVQQRHDETRACGPDRMAQRASSSVYIELLPRDRKILLRRHRNHRKGLVDLEEIDVLRIPVGLREQLTDGRNWGSRKPCRILAVRRVCADLGKHRKPLALGE